MHEIAGAYGFHEKSAFGSFAEQTAEAINGNASNRVISNAIMSNLLLSLLPAAFNGRSGATFRYVAPGPARPLQEVMKVPGHFRGFPAVGLQFLRDLESHNTREWFHANRSIYDVAVRQPMIYLLEALNEQLADYAPEYRIADPRKAVSRPNRDTRFGADKRPYRTEITAVLPRNGGPKHAVAGFFVGVAPEGVEVLGGSYMPGGPELAALRAFLDRHAHTFRRVIDQVEANSLVGSLQGERLKRVPAPFSEDSSGAEFVRYKQFYFRIRLAPSVSTTPALVDEVSQRFRAMTPFVEMLDAGLAEASA